MKILFINKYDIHGGAAIAAWRLQQTLHQNHQTTQMLLCGIKRSNFDFVKETRRKGWENFLERGVNFGFNQAGLQYFWFPFSTRRILQYTKEFQPDVISLHNLHGGFFKTSLLKELSAVAPLVWTLHDMWAYTANGAYTGGDSSWQEMKSGKGERKQFPPIGLNTGDYLLKRKKNIYADSRLTLIGPSVWMQSQARKSPLFNGKKVLHIPNGVNLDRFRPVEDRPKLRYDWGITPSQKILLLFAENINDKRKGTKDLIEILKKLDTPENKRIVLFIVGSGQLPLSFQYLTVRELGFISGETALLPVLQAADLFLFPTREDNLPNTLIEAISCGLPCITYDVGGCGEIIKNDFNGRLIPPGKTQLFFEELMRLLNQPEKLQKMRNHARSHAVENFDVREMAKTYYALFQRLLTQD